MTTFNLTRRPVGVRAVCFDGTNHEEVCALTGERFFLRVEPRQACVGSDQIVVAEVYDALHGQWIGVRAGQWIVSGVRAELYPVDDEVIRAGYEAPEGGWPA